VFLVLTHSVPALLGSVYVNAQSRAFLIPGLSVYPFKRTLTPPGAAAEVGNCGLLSVVSTKCINMLLCVSSTENDFH
jgi:hypothetical protein